MTQYLTIKDGCVWKSKIEGDCMMFVRLPIKAKRFQELSAQDILDSIKSNKEVK